MKSRIDDFVREATRAQDPRSSAASWSKLLDDYEQSAGNTASAWRESFERHGGEILVRSWPAALAAVGSERISRSASELESATTAFGCVLARLDRCQPLMQCHDDDFFQEHWIALGVRDALQAVLPPTVEDLADRWLHSLDVPDRPLGPASLFLLLCAMREHLMRRSSVWTRLRSAAIAAALTAAGSELSRMWWEDASLDLVAATGPGEEYDDESAGLRVAEWAAVVELQPRLRARPETITSLLPILVGLARRSGVAAVPTLRNLVRLVVPPEDAAPAQLVLWFGIALIARRQGRDEHWQPILEDIHARLANHVSESWLVHLGGLVSGDAELDAAVRLADRVVSALPPDVAAQGCSAPALLDAAAVHDREQAASHLARIGRAGGRPGRFAARNHTPQWEVAAAEKARVEPLFARAEAATLGRIDELEKEISRQCEETSQRDLLEVTHDRLGMALDSYGRSLQSLARNRALSRSCFGATAFQLACVRRRWGVADHIEDLERRLVDMLLGVQRVEVRVPDFEHSVPGAGEVVLDLLEANLLRSSSKIYLADYFAARPAAEIDAREVIVVIARGRANGWDLARTVPHRWERGESPAKLFELMLQLGEAARTRCGDKACAFFDKQIGLWRNRAKDLTWRREILESLARWIAPSDRELQQTLGRSGDASISMPRRFSDVVELTDLLTQLDSAVDAAWCSAGVALAEAGKLIDQLHLNDSDMRVRQQQLDTARAALERPTFGPTMVRELGDLAGRIASHVDYVAAFVAGTRSPIVALVREFLPDVGIDFPDGERIKLTHAQFSMIGAGKLDASSQPWLEAGIRHAAWDALSKGSDQRRKEQLVGALCLAWIDVRLLSEVDQLHRTRLLSDALIAQTALGLRLTTSPSRGGMFGRYHPLGEAEKSKDRVPLISAGTRLWALIVERVPPARRDELRAVDPERRMRTALVCLDETEHPFEEYRRIADVLYACSAMVAGYDSQVPGAALDPVIQALPSVELCQSVRPELRGKSELPAIEYVRAFWRLVLTFAAAYGRESTMSPTGFGSLLGNRTWTDLLKRTGTLAAVHDLLKYLRRIQSTEVGVDARQYARRRLNEAHTELAREDLDRMRKESDSVADVLLRQLARVANEYLHAASPVKEHVPLEITTPWETCFYDAQARRAWFYLHVRNLAREGAAEQIDLETDWKPLDRSLTLDEEHDPTLRLAERLYAGEQCARRIFVRPEWAERARNGGLNVELVLRYDRGAGRKVHTTSLSVQSYRTAALHDVTIFDGSKGRAVVGRAFHGRVEELTRMERALERGHNLELRGIRGIGKSSLLNELVRRLKQRADSRWIFVQLQTYGIDTAPDVREWYANIAVKLRRERLGHGELDVATLLATDPSPLIEEALQGLRDPTVGPDVKASYLSTLLLRVASSGWRIVLVLDQLEQLEDLWNHQQTGRNNVVHLVATLREWANDDKIRTDVHWILSGPPSFFDTIDRPDNRTQPHAGRGSEVIEVPPLDDARVVHEWVAAEVTKWLGDDRDPQQFYDSAFAGRIMQLAGGHPWIIAVYGSAVAELASRDDAVHRALTCADVGEAERQVFHSTMMDELRNRFVGDSLQKGPHTRLSYLLLILCAQKTDKAFSITLSELEDALRFEDIYDYVRDDVETTLAGLVRRGLLRPIGDGYACASHFLRRFFLEHPTLGPDFVERKVREIRAGESDARLAPVRHAPGVRLPVVAADWSQQFREVASQVTGHRDAAGRVAHLLSLALNCGPVHAVSHPSTQHWQFFKSSDDASDEAPREPDRSHEALRVLRETQLLLDEEMERDDWEPLCPPQYVSPTTWTSISTMAEAIARGIETPGEQVHACNVILDAIRSSETKRRIYGGLLAHVRQHTDRLRDRRLLLIEPRHNDGWLAPFFDVVGVIRRSDLVGTVLRSIARHATGTADAPIRIALSFDHAYRPAPVQIGDLDLKLMYFVVNLQWTGRTFGETVRSAGREHVDDLMKPGEWIIGGRGLVQIKPFAHALFRTLDVDRQPYERELTTLDGAPGPFPAPWRDDERWNWERLGHSPQTFSNALALAFPILRS